MNSKVKIKEFNPSGVGLKNDNFIGLPFTEESAQLVIIPIPWDVTVSYGEGTALAPSAILEASSQLDLLDPYIEEAWKMGIFMKPEKKEIRKKRDELRKKASAYIHFIEHGGHVAEDSTMEQYLAEMNTGCQWLNDQVYALTNKEIVNGKVVGIVGGDHSVPLGYIQALAENYKEFGILQIDAHLDLRKNYEGFTFSHASVFHHILNQEAVTKLVAVGIRDYCEEEMERVESEEDRISVYFDQKLKENRFNG
ncbi:MAG: arginase family protein, partial [Mariniphaga sp.]